MAHVVAIAGGVGGAKLALGLASVLPSDCLTVVVNTGDDDNFHGLHVSPDLDSVVYALAGMTNETTGWGVEGDSFRTLDALSNLGADTWFQLGDIDLATNIFRTQLLASGYTLSAATTIITEGLGVPNSVIPMSDDPVRTIVQTGDQEIAFQEYFVKLSCEPRISGLRFEGIADARPSDGFTAALQTADILIICPSNPFVSIGPILALPNIWQSIERFAGPRIAVSPVAAGRSFKGPVVKMMSELGLDTSVVGIAEFYKDLSDVLVIDNSDRDLSDDLRHLGVEPCVTNIVMDDRTQKSRLAIEILELADAMLGHHDLKRPRRPRGSHNE